MLLWTLECVCLFALVFLFISDKQIPPRSGIAESYGSSIFSFLRNLHTIVHNDFTNLISTNNVQGFPFPYILDNSCSVQFSSVTQSCLTLCDPIDCSMPGLPVHHLPESTQTHVHWVGDAIQPPHPLSSPSPPAFNHSQHQGLFQLVSSSPQVAKVLEFQLQHQSFQWIFRTGFL